MNKTEKWIVYFYPTNKKLQICQYHTESNSWEEAVEKTLNEGKEKYKDKFNILGVRLYPQHSIEHWINNKFL